MQTDIKKAPLIALAGLLALGLSGCMNDTGEAAGSGNVETVELRVATLYGPENWQTQAMQEFTNAVTESSDGAITFEYHYGDALLSADELAGGVRDGIVDMATIVPTYTAADFPVDAWASGLAHMAETSPVSGALQGVAATLEWSFETDGYREELTNNGLQPLIPRFLVHHNYGILCSEDNSSIEALQGKRTRVGSTTQTQEVEALDMIPTSVAGPETYSAFQQGLLDCSWTNVPDMVGLGLTDHAKHYNTPGIAGFSSMALVMGQDSWESLSPEAQQIIWDQLPVYLEAMIEKNFNENIQALEVEGMQWHTPDEATKSIIEDHHTDVESTLAQEAPGSVTDPQSAVDSLKVHHEDWLQRVEELGFTSEAQNWVEQVDLTGQTPPDISAWLEVVTEEILDEHAPVK